MELVKQETIADLYALRAGLSILSEIKDKVSNAEQIDAEMFKKVQGKKLALPLIKKIRDKSKVEYDEEIRTLQDELQNGREKAISEGNRPSYQDWCIWNDVCIAGIFIPPCLIVGLVALLIRKIIHKKKQKRYVKRCLWRWENKDKLEIADKLNSLQAEREEKFAEFDRKYTSKKEQIEKEIEKLEQNSIDAKKSINELLENFKFTYEKIRNQFSSVIDERDWQYLDLVIYYYETGRAVDLRDALMQVDTAKRHEEIIHVIDNAVGQISYNIRNGFAGLAQVIDNKMNLLNGSLLRVTDNLSNMQEQNRVMQKSFDKLNSTASAQQALLHKIDTSSNSMVEDVRYMKELQNRSYFKY